MIKAQEKYGGEEEKRWDMCVYEIFMPMNWNIRMQILSFLRWRRWWLRLIDLYYYAMR